MGKGPGARVYGVEKSNVPSSHTNGFVYKIISLFDFVYNTKIDIFYTKKGDFVNLLKFY